MEQQAHTEASPRGSWLLEQMAPFVQSHHAALPLSFASTDVREQRKKSHIQRITATSAQQWKRAFLTLFACSVCVGDTVTPGRTHCKFIWSLHQQVVFVALINYPFLIAGPC